jgi:hypothetical protein
MQNVFKHTIGALTGNSSFSLLTDVEYFTDDAKPCPHAISTSPDTFCVPVVVCAPADSGEMAHVCLHCAMEAARNASNGMLPAFNLLAPRK